MKKIILSFIVSAGQFVVLHRKQLLLKVVQLSL